MLLTEMGGTWLKRAVLFTVLLHMDLWWLLLQFVHNALPFLLHVQALWPRLREKKQRFLAFSLSMRL
jgi:hypothetical protein